MAMKEKNTVLKNYRGFEYITVIVPVKTSKHGDVITTKTAAIEKIVAEAMIKNRVPLRGKEVKFLRKVLGLSLEHFASEIGLTSGSIFKWEKTELERLHPINEIAVRSYMAERFEIDIPGKYSELLGNQEVADPFTLRAA